jgi:hypothetical protein
MRFLNKENLSGGQILAPNPEINNTADPVARVNDRVTTVVEFAILIILMMRFPKLNDQPPMPSRKPYAWPASKTIHHATSRVPSNFKDWIFQMNSPEGHESSI